jgi:hypothetical protein
MTRNVFSACYRLPDIRRQPHILPESIVEIRHVELPNDNKESLGSIFEPVLLRVSLLDLFAISGITKPLLAPFERQAIRLHMALCELSHLQASKSALRTACLILSQYTVFLWQIGH